MTTKPAPATEPTKRLPGHDWNAYELAQAAQRYQSYQALGVNLTTLQTAAADVAHWNRLYREIANTCTPAVAVVESDEVWNAVRDLMALMRSVRGAWCFNSLSRDALKLDEIMERFAALIETRKRQRK